MKKIVIFFIPILVISLFIGCGKETPYPSYGKDTISYFGDARFIIMDGSPDPDVFLWDQKENKAIDSIGSGNNYRNYRNIKPYVYTVGKKGYTKLNYDTAEYTQSENLKNFNADDQKIFKKLDENKNKLNK